MNDTTTIENQEARSGSLERMVRPMDCYVGIKPCGCMVAWVYDSKEHPKDVAKSVAQFIKDGYRVARHWWVNLLQH